MLCCVDHSCLVCIVGKLRSCTILLVCNCFLAMSWNNVNIIVCASSGRCLMNSFVIAFGPGALPGGARFIALS